MNNIKTGNENEGISFPMNEYFAFFILTLVAIGNSIFAAMLPKSLDKRKVANEYSGEKEISKRSKSNVKKTYVSVSTFKPNSF